MIKFDAINAVIERELLPSLTYDNPRAQLFTDWRFTGFQSDPSSTMLVGKVSARRLADNFIVHCNVTMYQDDVMRDPNQLFTQLDLDIKCAVEFIINWMAPHTPGMLCTENDYCEKCYS